MQLFLRTASKRWCLFPSDCNLWLTSILLCLSAPTIDKFLKIWQRQILSRILEEPNKFCYSSVSRLLCRKSRASDMWTWIETADWDLPLPDHHQEHWKSWFYESTGLDRSSIGAKLPKLAISKFQGTFLDWTRFRNQFQTEIEKAKLTQVAKVS